MNTMNVPAHIAARMSARQQDPSQSIAASIVGTGEFAFPKISLRAGRFRLVDDGVETPVGITLDVIIVGANPKVSKIFYSKAYDGGEAVRPDCFSNDGIRPDASSTAPVHTSCADCPHNVLGSKITPNGAKSKLCADQRHLAVVPAADPSKVYSLTVPVSGMKSLREYFKDLMNYNIEPQEVITELGFDESASFPKIVFKQKADANGHKKFVPEAAMGKIDEVVSGDAVKVAVRLKAPAEKAPALAAAPVAPAIAAPVAPPAPVVEEGYEEEAPKAEVAAGKATKAGKPKVEPVEGIEGLEAKLDGLFAA